MNIDANLKVNNVLIEAIPKNLPDIGFDLTADILESAEGRFPVCFYLTPIMRERKGGLFLVSSYQHNVNSPVETPELVKAYVSALTMFARNSEELFDRSDVLERIAFNDTTCFSEPLYRSKISDMPIDVRAEITRHDIAGLQERLADPKLRPQLVESWKEFSKDIDSLVASNVNPILFSHTARYFQKGDRRSIIPATQIFQNL